IMVSALLGQPLSKIMDPNELTKPESQNIPLRIIQLSISDIHNSVKDLAPPYLPLQPVKTDLEAYIFKFTAERGGDYWQRQHNYWPQFLLFEINLKYREAMRSSVKHYHKPR